MTTTFLDWIEPAAGGAFDPESSITWHSLFWAEGTAMLARGYTNGASVTTWDNETGETDLTSGVAPIYQTSVAALNNQPTVKANGTTTVLSTSGGFAVAPTYPISVVAIVTAPDGQFDILVEDDNSKAISIMRTSSSKWLAQQDVSGSVITAAGLDTPALFVFKVHADGTSTNQFWINGTSAGTATAKTVTVSGLTVFNINGGGANGFTNGHCALLGIYEGDFTADANYADFCTWVETHYGLTIA